MKRFFYLALYFFGSVFGVGAQPPAEHYFADAHRAACQQLEAYAPEGERLLGDTLLPEAWAVVYPELLRYSLWRDEAEIYLLQQLYVRYGAGYANFSIGLFQMKPSFAETLEHLAANCHCANPLPYLKGETPEQQRHRRLQQLTELKGQLLYLKAFFCVAYARFSWLKQAPPAKRIRFLAALYNYGIEASEQEVLDWMRVKAFPYGRYHSIRYAYAELAWQFYRQWVSQKQ
ncbi:hypothetical protein FHS56_000718 [Thermonema lapsum]|uniref:Transglycosylase n=1 Tax=Thermonema lapsum TaxID=28195 RepID=A0A846MPA2_9BACT|nr:hypothetical protein [Thermonema lapsum]NIK73232.1 hypothetical protein [Thermonema lapsum]